MPRSAATRPFRLATMTVFVAFSTIYVLLVARGLVTALLHEGALPPTAVPAACRSVDQCGDELRSLRHALDSKSAEVEQTGTQAERLWDDWSMDWQRQLHALQAACCLGTDGISSDRVPLERAATDVEKLGRLYGTHLVQYAREIGPQAERCAGDLEVIGSVSPNHPHPPPAPTPQNDPAHR